ncbi:alpha/beta hydrolase [Halioglobus maricola]|uniref:Alpha/beta hydrolase n=1 Tax=Halioglobus maricola TaxID=2601894 RepID=A0A5P9NKJ5_9GAMM|nr:alpha/beta hydrolase [Halioglobus maricola]QFU75764.1 alpha/beta hydrolase [Halioglobus maricola]
MKKNKSTRNTWRYMACFALIALVLVIASTFEELSRKVGFSSLPLPVNTSEEMRASLSEEPAMGATLYKFVFKFMSVNKLMEQVAEADTRRAALVEEIADRYSVSIEQDYIEGVNVYWLTPETIDPKHEDHLFINLHGGGYIMGAGMSSNNEAVLIAARGRIRVLSVDYRMPPDHPAPAGLNDVAVVWKYLLNFRPADSMALGGTSAGGGLTLGSTHMFKDLGLELPGALYVGTPGGDCHKTGDSHYTNEGNDRALISWHGVLRMVCGDIYPGELGADHPYVSPLRGEFENFPPSYLISGTRDLLLSDTVLVHRKLRRAGVEADLHVYEGQSHADYSTVWDSPESREHYAELNAFLLKHLR